MKLKNKLWSYPYIVILLILSWLLAPFLFFADIIVHELDRLNRLK